MIKSIITRIIRVTITVLTLALGLVISFYHYGIRMPGESYRGPVPELSANTTELRDRLSNHVRVLAVDIGNRRGGRGSSQQRAAEYIEQEFADMGYVPRLEIFTEHEFINVVVDHYGSEDREKILLIGAHYDSNWTSPGADDNASGIAGMLEIARMFRETRLPLTVRFVAFANEEFPFYGTDEMGSLHHASQARERNEEIIAMFSLEMLGFYADGPESQYYPWIISPFYPRTGNFIAFVSNVLSRPLLIDTIATFRTQVAFPSEGLAAPQWLVRAIRRSDHASFWVHGYRAIMITDTANFRNYGYHSAGDTHSTLDYHRMALLVEGLAGVFQTLASQYHEVN